MEWVRISIEVGAAARIKWLRDLTPEPTARRRWNMKKS